MKVGTAPSAAVSDAIIVAVARLVDDAQTERRDPSHSDLGFLFERASLSQADLTTPAGKEKRVRHVLSWAVEHNDEAGARLVAHLIATIRSCGGFRPESPNFVGLDAIKNAQAAFATEGFELAEDGQLGPILLEGLEDAATGTVLRSYIRRAMRGSEDAALVIGTAKDVLEATAGYVLLSRYGSYSQTDNFPTLLGQAFTAAGLATPGTRCQPEENQSTGKWNAGSLRRVARLIGCATRRGRVTAARSYPLCRMLKLGSPYRSWAPSLACYSTAHVETPFLQSKSVMGTPPEEGGRHPRAFLSHSSEDKDRFVHGFAEKLRDRGIDIWYADWELLPGDSLIDKIFEEGLKDAEAFLIVLSRSSVESRWVREELDAAFLRKIEQQCKVIPVVIDDCEIPEVLKHTVWQRIEDIESYDAALDRIVRALHDERVRPALGEPPEYTDIRPIEGLHATDTRILQAAGETALETGQRLLDTREILHTVGPDGINEEALLESLEVLEGRGYIHIAKTIARGIDGMSAFSLTVLGLHQFAESFVPDYEEMMTAVAAHLVNNDGGSDGEIAGSLDRPRQLIENILDLFEMQGWVKTTKMTGPATLVHWVSPELKRQISR